MRHLLLFFALLVSLSALGAHAQATGEWSDGFTLPGVTGPVHALAESDGRLYVGGDFIYAGSEIAFKVGAYDLTEEEWIPLGGGVDGAVFSLAVGPDGTLYTAGQFQTAGGNPALNIASYDPASGVWNALGEGLAGFAVYDLVFGPDGLLYAGGEFDMAGGIEVKNLARWDGMEWETVGEVGSGFSYITSLIFHDSFLYVGGNFGVAGGVAARNVARYNPATEAWSGLGGGVDADVLAEVQAMAVSADGVFVGGTFDEALQPDGSVLPVNNVARWDPEAETWSALGEGTEFLLYALAFGPDGSLYAGGEWQDNVLRRWDGTAWASVDPGPVPVDGARPVQTILATANALYVGHAGYFFFEGDNPNNFLHRYEPEQEQWSVLGSPETGGFTDDVLTLVTTTGGEVYAGGIFHFAGTHQIDYVARWNGTGWEPLGQGMGRRFGGLVEGLLYSRDGSIYVGGRFDEVFQADGTEVASKSVARWDGEQWERLGGGLELGVVRAFAEAEDGMIYVGGRFLEVVQGDGEQLDVQSLARWDPSTERWEAPPEGHGFDGIYSMIVDEAGALYVGGYRIIPGTGESRARVSRLDPQTQQWTALREWAFTLSVEDLAVVGNPAAGGALYAAAFTEGVWRWQDDVWVSLGGLEVVRSLALNGDPETNGVLYAGGANQNASGPYVQQWNGASWSGLGSGLTGFVSAPFVHALAVGDAEREDQVALWAGGEFIAAGGQPSSCIARWVTEDLGTAAEGGASAEAFGLEAYPNPTTGAATFRYTLDTSASVRLAVYDVLGREVAVLVDAEQPSGTYEAPFERDDLAAGVYVVQMKAGVGAASRVLTRRVTVLR